jgi:hypothetical protein
MACSCKNKNNTTPVAKLNEEQLIQNNLVTPNDVKNEQQNVVLKLFNLINK